MYQFIVSVDVFCLKPSFFSSKHTIDLLIGCCFPKNVCHKEKNIGHCKPFAFTFVGNNVENASVIILAICSKERFKVYSLCIILHFITWQSHKAVTNSHLPLEPSSHISCSHVPLLTPNCLPPTPRNPKTSAIVIKQSLSHFPSSKSHNPERGGAIENLSNILCEFSIEVLTFRLSLRIILIEKLDNMLVNFSTED